MRDQRKKEIVIATIHVPREKDTCPLFSAARSLGKDRGIFIGAPSFTG